MIMSNALKILPDKKTMSSLEIAKLTGKDHSKVMSDIKKVLEEVEINHAVFGEVYKAGNGVVSLTSKVVEHFNQQLLLN
jgi:phage regulator Rha-like protein